SDVSHADLPTNSREDPEILFPLSRALLRAGSSRAARIAITAITTSSSINVKLQIFLPRLLFHPGECGISNPPVLILKFVLHLIRICFNYIR
ncbi:hypothetical protein, partial [Victivallis vadensis]|uniref:hypothetical protein n=1 Tax=Victivallis vadensis TaxID=172901 RepID=UPI00307D9D5E